MSLPRGTRNQYKTLYSTYAAEIIFHLQQLTFLNLPLLWRHSGQAVCSDGNGAASDAVVSDSGDRRAFIRDS